MTTTCPADRAADRAALQVVALAGRAPSIHNTQPWAWRIHPGSLELFADRTRQLPHIDPSGRNLLVSCGAALHHAVVAAHALGLAAQIDRFPDDDHDPDLLARVHFSPGERGAEEMAQLLALGSRRTDRRRFTSWPVPPARLEQLASTAEHWGVRAVPVHDASGRWRVDTLVAQAHRRQAADAAVRREHEEWLDRSDVDGVPSAIVPRPSDLPGAHRPRFTDGLLDQGKSDLDTEPVAGDGVLVLGGTTDDRHSWLTTGMGLSALWLHAERGGLSVVPLTQVVEVDETRRSLALTVLRGRTAPHILLRVGWQPISRSPLPRTPRRPLEDVLRP